MVSIDVSAGGFLFHVGEDLLPAGQILHQAVESFKSSESDKRSDKDLFVTAILADDLSKVKGDEAGKQDQEMAARRVRIETKISRADTSRGRPAPGNAMQPGIRQGT